MPATVECPKWVDYLELPNLDCFVSPDELNDVRRELEETISGLEQLKSYAAAKQNAMHCRLRGNIPMAIRFENACQAVYVKLPRWARW
jgi:hypothetical protein